VAWYLPDERVRYANMPLDRIEDSVLVVPSIWAVEMANAFIMAERRGRVDREAADSFVGSLRPWRRSMGVCERRGDRG
jgi:hypothetical protein